MSRQARSMGAAGVALLVLAASANAQPAPRPLSILDVPFISQSEALCGGAAAAMVLRYWGERGLDAESFAHLVDRSAAGIRTTRLVDDLRERGWSATAVDGTEDLVSGELASGRPVLTLIEDRPGTFHYVVIVAATPRAVVFHDPARSPFRVMDRDAFAERWAAADRWMAIVVPGASTVAAPLPPPSVESVGGASSCDALLLDGTRRAQAGELDAAERSLTLALSCGGPAPWRELAGLRLLQRRWPDVRDLASAALAEDPLDTHAWELLATSRFVQDDPAGALEAWNRLDQPHVDLLTVDGLARTRQRVVERLLAVQAQALLTPRLLSLTERRLRELPSATSTRLEYVPMSSGLAELRAHVVERPLVPSDPWSYMALGILAAARNKVAVSLGAFTGGGERIDVDWRFWPGRPRVELGIVAPAPWGGLWGVDVSGERQPFSSDAIPVAERVGAGMTISNWVRPWARVSVRGGVDFWDGRGSYGAVSSALHLTSNGERIAVDVDGSGWAGTSPFASIAIAVVGRSTKDNRGRVYVARGGGAAATGLTPPDIWFSGDTGRTRPVPLRAHPVIERGELRVNQIGRRIAHVSVEAQQWTNAPRIAVGGAVFVDAARVTRRLMSGSKDDVDVGAGIRVAVPGLAGVFRLDIAKGLRDGATALAFVYEPRRPAR